MLRCTPAAASPPISGVIFDVDGTLYDLRAQWLRLVPRVLPSLGLLRAWRDALEASRGARVPDLPARISRSAASALGRAPEPVEATLRDLLDGVWPASFSPDTPFPGIRELLRWLDERGLPRAVVSDLPATAKLRAMDLAEGWRVVVDCSELGALKPLPDGLLLAAEALALPPRSLLYVADREDTDLGAALAAGVECLLRGRDWRDARELRGLIERRLGCREGRDPLRNLYVLRGRVEAHARRVLLAHARHIACRPGCSGCCAGERTVTEVEYAALERGLSRLDPRQVRRLRLAPRGDACPLLLDDRCALYAERPLICRTHGLPVLMEGRRDACPSSFRSLDLEDLPASDLLSVDTLTAMLVAVNGLHCRETGADPRRRRPVSELLAESRG